MREGIIKHSDFQGRPAALEFDPSTCPCLEAQIVDQADEIAYLAHDVDDGVKAQMLTGEDLNPSVLYRSASAQARESVHDGDVRVVGSQTVIRMIDAMSTDLVTQIASDVERSAFRSVDGIRRAGRRVAAFSPQMTLQVAELKEIMRQRLYRHYRVNRMTEKAGRVLARLFETYLAEPGQMPEHILKRAEQDHEAIARVVADYVAGMTDRFALDEYRKLFDPDERV